jgi:hypothetical protein
MAVGFPVGILVGLYFWGRSSLWPWVLLQGLLLSPTVVQPFLQKKAFKVLSRTSLGVSCGVFGVMTGWLANGPGSSWLLLTGALITFLILAKALLALRERFTADPCRNCPLGRYPVCSWNLPQLINAEDPELAAVLSDPTTTITIAEAGGAAVTKHAAETS